MKKLTEKYILNYTKKHEKFSFDPFKVRKALVKWIQEWFCINGKDCNAVLGISGGKDSTIVAALLSEALGSNRVIGVMLPNGVQPDINDSERVINLLNIKSRLINIKLLHYFIANYFDPPTLTASINLSPRLRATLLWYVAQCNNGRYINTSNLSEYLAGWFTNGGDDQGVLFPLLGLTKTEVVAIGLTYVYDKILPLDLVEKSPGDGLTGKTDEDNFGFSYDDLDNFIRTDNTKNSKYSKVTNRMLSTDFKRRLNMNSFCPKI